MKRAIWAICVGFGLVGCGADGPPLRPTAAVGVSVGAGGVTTSTSVAATNGAVTVGVNL